MESDQVLGLAGALLVPVVPAVVGAVAIAFQDWRVRRSLAGKRKLAFEDATRQVTFAGEWWKATGTLLDPSSEALRDARARATAWLDEASALVGQVEAQRSMSRYLTDPSVDCSCSIRSGGGQQMVRVAYFVSVGWWLLVIGELITDALVEPKTIGSWMLVAMISPAMVVLVLRTVAVSVDDGEYAPEGALLLRRLHRRPAVVIQLLYFISIVLVIVQAKEAINDIAYYTKGAPEELAELIVLVAVAIGLRSWALWIEFTRPDDSPKR